MNKKRLTLFMQKEIVKQLKILALENNLSTSKYIESLITRPNFTYMTKKLEYDNKGTEKVCTYCKKVIGDLSKHINCMDF